MLDNENYRWEFHNESMEISWPLSDSSFSVGLSSSTLIAKPQGCSFFCSLYI